MEAAACGLRRVRGSKVGVTLRRCLALRTGRPAPSGGREGKPRYLERRVYEKTYKNGQKDGTNTCEFLAAFFGTRLDRIIIIKPKNVDNTTMCVEIYLQ